MNKTMRNLFLVLLLLTACDRFPVLEDTLSDEVRTAPYPQLTPLPTAPEATDAETESMQERIAALEARAAMMR